MASIIAKAISYKRVISKFSFNRNSFYYINGNIKLSNNVKYYSTRVATINKSGATELVI